MDGGTRNHEHLLFFKYFEFQMLKISNGFENGAHHIRRGWLLVGRRSPTLVHCNHCTVVIAVHFLQGAADGPKDRGLPFIA